MNPQYVKYITDFNNQELTFLIDPYYSDGGMFAKEDGTVIDLEGGVIWLRMQLVDDVIIKSHGVMSFKSNRFKIAELQTQEYPATAETLNVHQRFIADVHEAPEITIHQLRDLLLDKLKKIEK